ncbi:Ig-like domain-containing protein [Vibrio sp. Hep-1b-8]|uniref:Ig-like domain-containing protein n=1 Tax=Vibrio sp. Hep-1b-8 TaxID=2144187 RepID=UPI0011106472|nr:Ig-like domain-containing protein [Vibrio sp. Hep-1b-8]TMX31542.1 hypothetical protein DA100_19490 [Vibrio sp. Hep-1b-8]
MIQFFNIFFTLVGLTLLVGCNSEGAFNSLPQPSVDATVIEISVTPSPISVLKGRTKQLVALAKFDDGTEFDISDSVTWAIVGDPTIASISASGLLTGIAKGSTAVTAMKGGVISNTVNVNVCDLAGACIDIFDVGNGKLFTNSPSVAYLDSINVGGITNGTYTENGSYGPTGDFYQFNWANANALCVNYNTYSIGGRTNWRLATKDELKVELFDRFGNMFTAHGWPTYQSYWSITPDGSLYYEVDLNSGIIISINPSVTFYVSCISEP